MTIKASGNPLAFSEIEAEFGGTPVEVLEKYRRDDPVLPMNHFLVVLYQIFH